MAKKYQAGTAVTGEESIGAKGLHCPALLASLQYLQAPVQGFGQPQRLQEQAALLDKKMLPLLQPRQRDLERLFRRLRREVENSKEDSFTVLQAFKVREIKSLPWLLYYEQANNYLQAQPDFLAALIKQIVGHSQLTLRTFIFAFLQNYDRTAWNYKMSSSLLQTMLTAYQGSRPSLRHWQQQRAWLLSPDGVEIIASRLVQDVSSVPAVLTAAGLTGRLAVCRFLWLAVTEAVKKLYQHYPRGLERLPDILETKAPAAAGEKMSRFQQLTETTAGEFICRAGASSSLSEREILLPFYLRRLGDPGQPEGRTAWQAVENAAAPILKGWLNQADLELFFTILARGSGREERNWLYRLSFWQAFLPGIDHTWLALFPSQVEELQETAAGAYLRDRGWSRLSGAGKTQQALLLVEIKGYVFADWAEKKSLAVWPAAQLALGSPVYPASRFYRTPPLEEWDILNCRSDSYLWQHRVESWLYRQTGISRARTYEVANTAQRKGRWS